MPPRELRRKVDAADSHGRSIDPCNDMRSTTLERLRILASLVASIVAWAWALLAGVGGLALLIHQGPWPITNGWFAMFSGLAACPLSAVLLKKFTGFVVPGYVRFLVAALILVAGRIAVVVLLDRPFVPECSDACW